MRDTTHALVILTIAVMSSGCSSELSRREAKRQIETMLEPHTIGVKKIKRHGGVPGFSLPSEDSKPSDYFTLDRHEAYGGLAWSKPEPPCNTEYTLDALSKLGYILVKEEGATTKLVYGMPLRYSHSRTVAFTGKAGAKLDGKPGYYSSGFECYPPPEFTQCNMPALLKQSPGFSITGVVQDATHARVNILIPWTLTTFGMELKPYADLVRVTEDKRGIDSGYDNYPASYSWEHFLNGHNASGSSPAAVLFQKFDDGWRIVDQSGKSEKYVD